MTGFLSRLVERTHDAAPHVEPTVPALFSHAPTLMDAEPDAPRPQPAVESTRDGAAENARNRVEPFAVASEAKPPTARANSADDRSERQAIAPVLKHTTDADLSERIDRLIERYRRLAPRDVTPAPVGVRTIREVVHHVPDVRAAAQNASDASPAPRPRAVVPAAAAESGRTDDRSRRSPAEAVRPLDAGRQAQNHVNLIPPGPVPEPRPIVRISIGRLEVRAVTAAPAAPVLRPPAPKAMGLDEYLAKRSGSAR